MDTEEIIREVYKRTLREVIDLAKEYHFELRGRCECVCHRVGTRVEGIGNKRCKHCFYEQLKLLLADA